MCSDMKTIRIVLTAALVAGLTACGKQDPEAAARKQLRIEGMKLARLNGCVQCHDETGSVVGPTWREVSQRYRNVPQAREILIASVTDGSAGKWADITKGARMPPYGKRVTDEHIRKIVDYILSIAR